MCHEVPLIDTPVTIVDSKQAILQFLPQPYRICRQRESHLNTALVLVDHVTLIICKVRLGL